VIKETFGEVRLDIEQAVNKTIEQLKKQGLKFKEISCPASATGCPHITSLLLRSFLQAA